MKTAIFIILILHGLIHLLGFIKGFDLLPVSQLSRPVSRLQGLGWLMAALLLIGTAVLFIIETNWWWIPGIAALLLSQCLIIMSWQDARFGTIANIILLAIIIVGYSQTSFENKFEQDLMGRKSAAPTTLLTEADISPLPAPI